MEVGVPSGAHFQLARRDPRGRKRIKSRLILLFTRDGGFAQSVREALFGTGAIVLIAREVRDALQIVCQRGRELDFALMDFDRGCRGMTLLSALHTCHAQLPIVVTTSEDAGHCAAVALANGARACLNKPLHATELAHVLGDLNPMHSHLIAA
jgi:CheY-like chemotaxis protein